MSHWKARGYVLFQLPTAIFVIVSVVVGDVCVTLVLHQLLRVAFSAKLSRALTRMNPRVHARTSSRKRANILVVYTLVHFLPENWQSRTILRFLPGLWINRSFSSYEASLLCIPSRNEEHTLYVAPGFTMSLNYRLWYHFVRSYTRETGSIRASTEEIARLDVEAESLFINWPETRNPAGDILLERCTSVCTILNKSVTDTLYVDMNYYHTFLNAGIKCQIFQHFWKNLYF